MKRQYDLAENIQVLIWNQISAKPVTCVSLTKYLTSLSRVFLAY